jgi:sensor histidine kinase YesM
LIRVFFIKHNLIKVVQKNVDNPNNHLQTIKKDKENHGYGLNNIRKIVEKYRGLLL